MEPAQDVWCGSFCNPRHACALTSHLVSREATKPLDHRKLINIPLEQVALWFWAQHSQIPPLLRTSSHLLSLSAFITNTSWKPLQVAVCTVIEPNYHGPPAYILVGELGHTLQNMYSNTSEPKWHAETPSQTSTLQKGPRRGSSQWTAGSSCTNRSQGRRERNSCRWKDLVPVLCMFLISPTTL